MEKEFQYLYQIKYLNQMFSNKGYMNFKYLGMHFFEVPNQSFI